MLDLGGELILPVGWEYAVESGIGTWVPYERNIHLSRRCRWVRLRVRDKDSKAVEKKRVRRVAQLHFPVVLD